MKMYEDVFPIERWGYSFFFFRQLGPNTFPEETNRKQKTSRRFGPPKRRRNNHQFWGDFFFYHAHRMPPHGTRAWYIYGSMGWRRFLQVFMYVGRYLIKTRPMDAYRACFFLPIYYICFITCVWVHRLGAHLS